MSLEIENLGKWYSQERAIEGVSFSVADGEFCVVLGPSGGGKTTLLMSIAGLVEPDTGSVRVDDKSVLDTPVKEREFGVVFQDFEERLFPHMTVAENVAFGPKQNGQDQSDIDEQVTEMLELLAIEHTKDDYPPELSGGQQQRVDLARQLIRDVETLLLDDPLSDLDYKLQKYLELELRRIQNDRGNTILYVTHNQDQSFKLADKLVVLNRGRVEQAGPPEEIYHDPGTGFVARFVGDSNMFPADRTDDGMLTTPIGEMRVGGTSETTESETGGIAMVRPEDITFGEGTNTVTGTLEQRIYTGERTEFIVSVADEVETFQIQRQGNVGLDELRVAVGGEVTLSWEPDQMHYFGSRELSVTDEMTVTEILEV